MRFALLLIIQFLFASTQAQSWHFNRDISWKHPVSGGNDMPFKDLTSFSGAYFEDISLMFPFYFEKIPLEKDISSVSLSFFRFSSEKIPTESFPEEFLNELSDEFSIVYEQAKAAGEQFLQFRVFPFRKNISQGTIERLTSFALQMDVEKSDAPAYRSNRKSYLVEESPLAEGNWFKVRTAQEGMHKITYSELVSLGVDNPANTKIYGWGGERLPEDSRLGRQDEFVEIPVYIFKGTDGIFNSNDYLLFYARGTTKWTYNESENFFRHEKNPYSDYGYYFITSGNTPPALPASLEPVPGETDYVSKSFDALYFYENDEINLIASGKEWYGELFDITVQRTFTFDVPGLIPSSDIMLRTSLLGRSKEPSSYYIYANNQILDTAEIRSTNLSDYTATFAFPSSEIYTFNSTVNKIDIRLKFNKPDPSAQGWLDYLAINARSELHLSNGQLLFRDKTSRSSSLVRYEITGATASTVVWDITQYPLVSVVAGELSGGTFAFTHPGGYIPAFVAFDPAGAFPTPELSGTGLGKIDNQNLKGSGHPDMVIIAYEDFLPSAEKLAGYRRKHNDIEVIVTTPGKIYNEFSSGRPDMTAIRNYMSYLYNSAGDDKDLLPRYLLLLGDGSYIFKSDNPLDGNFVPAYQSDNSLSPVSSFVSDDFFGLLDEGESIANGLLDIGIGRLPVNTTVEAERMVDKIIDYESPARMGEWRNTIAFIGDDEDNNIHFNQADQLARYVENNYPGFNVNKIYLDAYQQVSTPVGQRYPAVNTAINNQVNKGALIVNYTGHGGTKGLAHEQILGLNDIQSWENEGKLPLFMTATCEFSRFDKPDIVSAGELVILSETGGGIALFTTTRLVYSGPNHVLNEKFYEVVFEKTEGNKNYCLGEIMQYSKNNAGFGINKRNFALLGDPAMRLTYPFYNIVADSINQSPAESATDTLKALSEIRVSGFVQDVEGRILDTFIGEIYPIVYDKASEQTTLANDGGQKKNFTIRNNILYKGKATVEKGMFSFSFKVPKDINYAFGSGKMSFYAADSSVDASGAYLGFVVGGSEKFVEIDDEGPDLEVYMNNPFFLDGGITTENPVLLLKVKDNNGINTTGNGIGHDITAVLNGNTQNTLVLNEYYQSDLDSYQSGTVRYPLFNIEEGRHEIDVKVWDIYNNSTSGSIEFIVMKSREMLLENLMNYPNPFSESTFFSFEHNKADQELDITIDIFDMEGSLVRTIKARESGAGFRSQPVYWDGKNESGNHNRQGTYIYRIRVQTTDGSEAMRSGRLIILR